MYQTVYMYIVYNWMNQNDANYQQRRRRIIQIIYVYMYMGMERLKTTKF